MNHSKLSDMTQDQREHFRVAISLFTTNEISLDEFKTLVGYNEAEISESNQG